MSKAVKTSPILFTGPMVRAILDGRKTQTRRLIDPQPELVPDESLFGRARGSYWWASRAARSMMDLADIRSLSPYGSSGDRLWVRETWRRLSRHPAPTMEVPPVVDVGGAVPTYQVQHGVAYKADGAFMWRDHITTIFDATGGEERGAKSHLSVANEPIKWKPSIHMRRHDSRITLDITDVRVERLNDITEEDAKAEGAQRFDDIPDHSPYGRGGRWSMMKTPTSTDECFGSARMAFASAWDSINSKRAPWSSDPWVWVVIFKRSEP